MMMTGSMAIVPAAASFAQKRPSEVTNPIMYIGAVAPRAAIRLTARKNSFQAKMAMMNMVATRPGMTIGTEIRNISCQVVAPSTRLASMTSRGISSKKDRINHTAMGRFIAVYMMMSAMGLSMMSAVLAM